MASEEECLPLYHKGLIGGVLQRWLSFWKVLPSPQKNSGALSEWWPKPPPPIAQFRWTASSRKSLGGSKLLPFKNDGVHCALGIFNISELYGQFLQPPGLVFALTCTVNYGTLYRQVCAFPNHSQSIEFTTGGLQSSWMIKETGCTWAQFLVS